MGSTEEVLAGRSTEGDADVKINESIINRWFAWQCRFGIAKDLRLPEGQVRARACLMGLPVRDRAKIVPDYVEGRPYDASLEARMIRHKSRNRPPYFLVRERAQA